MSRSPAFDPELAVERAMRVFWKRGFEATSIRELEKALRINRSSIYNTLGDKNALLMAALHRYQREVMRKRVAPLHTHEGLDAIRAFWAQAADILGERESRVGCLMANCGIERPTPQAVARVRDSFREIEDAFHARLRRAARLGELRDTRQLRDRARFLTMSFQGVLVGLRMGQSDDTLRGAIRSVLDVVESWCAGRRGRSTPTARRRPPPALPPAAHAAARARPT